MDQALEQKPRKVEAISLVCPNCLANVSYSSTSASVTCKYCGYTESLIGEQVGTAAGENLLTTNIYKDAQIGWGRDDRREVHCENCLANFSVPQDEVTTKCPFCGTNKIVADQQGPDAIRPMFVLPFEKEFEEVQTEVDAWLNSNSWILPRKLIKSMDGMQFQAIYLPFWTFDATVSGSWKGYLGEDMGVEVLRDVVPAPSKHDYEDNFFDLFDDFVASGSKHVPPELLRWMSDFDLSKLATYDPNLLTGRAAHAYEIQLHDAWNTAQLEMRRALKHEVRAEALAHEELTLNMAQVDIDDFGDVSWRYVLLPVYMATYDYEGETHHVLVNGQSGTVVAKRPVNAAKIFGKALLWLLPALFLSSCALLVQEWWCLLPVALPVIIGFVQAGRIASAAWAASRASKANAQQTKFVRTRDIIFVNDEEKVLV